MNVVLKVVQNLFSRPVLERVVENKTVVKSYNVARGFSNNETATESNLTSVVLKKIRPLLDSKRLVSYKVQGFQLTTLAELYILEQKLSDFFAHKDIDIPFKLSVNVLYKDTDVKTRSLRGDVFITPL